MREFPFKFYLNFIILFIYAKLICIVFYFLLINAGHLLHNFFCFDTTDETDIGLGGEGGNN